MTERNGILLTNSPAITVYKAELKVMQGKLSLQRFRLTGAGEPKFPKAKILAAGDSFFVVLKQ